MGLKHDPGYSGACYYCGMKALASEDCPKRVNEKPPHAVSYKPQAAAAESIIIANHPIGTASAPIDSKLGCEHRWIQHTADVAHCDKCGKVVPCVY